MYTKGSYKNSSKPNYALFDRDVAGDNMEAALNGGKDSNGYKYWKELIDVI